MSRGSDYIARLREQCLPAGGPVEDRLMDAGADLSRGAAWLNVRQPDQIRRVHGEAVDAGATLIDTNTIGGSGMALARQGLGERCAEINIAGARLAVEAAGKSAVVAGAIGPLGLTLDEDWDLDTLRDAYVTQAAALAEGGVHLFRLASFTNLPELLFAVRVIREKHGAELPMLAQMIFGDGGRVASGETADEAAQALVRSGADLIGAEGGRSIASTLHATERLAANAGQALVAAHPNAGHPEADGGRLVYMASPAYMAETALRLVKAGARLIGGCGGATPEMVRAVALALTTLRAKPVSMAGKAVASAPAAPQPSGFKTGGFLSGLPAAWPVIAEIDPPGHLLFQGVIEDARAAAKAGADAISMAENPLASLKMSNIALAGIVRREIGVQTICHQSCRDHNLLGIQSLLMGLHALDIQAVLALTGDPLGAGTGAGRSVFDLNSFTLTRLVAGLNRGVSQAGVNLKAETNFSLGVAFNSSARNLAGEAQRLKRKLDEGARFVMTQPVFDAEHGRRVLEMVQPIGMKIFLGFFPLVSARSALYLHNEVPGIHIPEAVLKMLTAISSKEDQEKAGLEACARLLDDLRDDLRAVSGGVYLISPHNRAQLLVPLIRQVCAWRGA